MSPGFILRSMLRESRGARGRLLFFVACLAVGVAAVTGVAGLVGGVEAGVRARSREVLAADLSVDGRRPLPPELDELLADVPGLERTDLREMATMAAAPGPDGGASRSRLAQLRVVRGRYPLYGEVETDPPRALDRPLGRGEAVVAADLLPQLGVAKGGIVLLGGAEFRIAAVVLREPGRIGVQTMLGPRVYLGEEGLERTKLLGFGNRVKHVALFRVPGEPDRASLERLKERLEKGLPDARFLDVETHFEADANLGRQMRRLESTIGLTALLSLVLGGIGVSQIVSSWLEGKASSVAVLRCLGMRPRDVLLFYLGHVALLSLAGSLLGAAAGSLIPLIVPAMAPDLFPAELFVVFQAGALLKGVGLGLGTALLFSLPPLTALWRVPPARVLRSEAEPLPPPRALVVGTGAALAAGLFLAALAQTGRWEQAAGFSGGLVVLAALLAAGARGAMRLSSLLPRERMHPFLRHGVAALARPGAGTTGAVTALGLGVMVVTGMWLVETRLLDGLRASVPPDAPSVFLVDVQPAEWEGVRGILEGAGGTGVDHVPVVMARLAFVDGRRVEDLAREADAGDRARWVLTREQRITWRESLPADNRIVEGALWSDPARAEASLEAGFARDLEVGVGGTVVFGVQGIPMEFLVTSLRSVEWTSFAINFFVVVEPGSMEGAPAFEIANARLDEGAEQGVQDALAAAHPGVTMIRVRPLVERVVALLKRVAFGIRALGSFTILAGLAIMAGAVSAATLRRTRETALLKTLGVTRRGVAVLLGVEFGLAGFVAGAIGAGGALALCFAFLEGVADLPVSLPWEALPISAAGCAALTALCGLAASTRALMVRPVESLRSQ